MCVGSKNIKCVNVLVYNVVKEGLGVNHGGACLHASDKCQRVGTLGMGLPCTKGSFDNETNTGELCVHGSDSVLFLIPIQK